MSRSLSDTDFTLQQLLQHEAWYRCLAVDEQQLVERTAFESWLEPGAIVACAGDPALHWMGVVEGLMQLYVVGDDARDTTLACISAGDWFGEGSLLKRERRRYHVIALQPSRIIFIPIDTFFQLRDRSLGFNHHLLDLMNARMSVLINTLEVDRLLPVELRVAKCIARLCREVDDRTEIALELSQHELALICGLSRQRVNAALGALAQMGLIRIEFGRLRILDLLHLQKCESLAVA